MCARKRSSAECVEFSTKKTLHVCCQPSVCRQDCVSRPTKAQKFGWFYLPYRPVSAKSSIQKKKCLRISKLVVTLLAALTPSFLERRRPLRNVRADGFVASRHGDCLGYIACVRLRTTHSFGCSRLVLSRVPPRRRSHCKRHW